MDVLQLQLLFMGVIFIVTTAVGLTPVLLQGNCKKCVALSPATRQRLLSCATCFGAGVFLFVCFLGLLPEADYKFHQFLNTLDEGEESSEAVTDFPWGFFVVTCGFLIIFTIDKIVHGIDHKRRQAKVNQMNGTGSLTTTPQPKSYNVNDKPLIVREGESSSFEEGCHNTEGHGVPSSAIFLAALGIHSVFEGIAVGLQTQKDKVLEFALAVLVHETVSKSHAKKRISKIIYVILFTGSIPIGIGIGVSLQSTPSDSRDIVSAVCEAFATGIFLHVIFIEILAKEFPAHSHELQSDVPQKPSEICIILEKIFSICCGLFLMILLNMFMHIGH